MRTRVRTLVGAAAALTAPLALSGCLEGMSFHADRRLRIVEPLSGDYVEAPLRVRWSAHDLDPSVRGYAVFVDRAPIARDHSMDDLKSQVQVNIYRTRAPQLVISSVAPRTGVAKSLRDRHEITVIALDAEGVRVGETSDWIELTVVQP